MPKQSLVVALAMSSLGAWDNAAAADVAAVAVPAASAPADPSRDGPPPPELDLRVAALEILGFQFLVNRVNRYFGTGRENYRVTGSSIRDNLKSGWGTDKDPFETNQLGHPYQGAMYHGFARSAGYAFAGSAVWEIAGERTPPSRNDQIASGVGGTFLGEALFRMSNLVLEKGGGMPRFWREMAAAAIDPSAGFNRLAFGERYGSISSHDAAYFSQLALGYSASVKRDLGSSTADFKRNEAQVNFAIDYGLPGSRGYEYTRPFDYFNFAITRRARTASRT
jgi:hypothetical protein